MTNREFLDKNYNTIRTLQHMYFDSKANLQSDQLTPEEFEKKLKMLHDSTEFAISAIRHNLVRIYNAVLQCNFKPVNHTTFGDIDAYLTEDTYFCRKAKLCCAQFTNNNYFIVNCKTSYIDYVNNGTIEMESPDDYPFHEFPKEYIRYDYPEQAMLYWTFNNLGIMDNEAYDFQIGKYNWEIETYVD